jgi:5-methyltetrahydropteroyltriglutamate--homocysteine methyltransferase
VELENEVMAAARGPEADAGAPPGLSLGVEDSAAARSIRGPVLTFGLHVCRGNQAGRWLVSGGYGALARAIFPRTRADRLLLEFDDERSGGFEPLDEVPEEKTVVLGLVSTKRRRLEDMEALETRIREAARHHPLERLAVSPQCGFSTSVLGSSLGPDEQAAKLRLVVVAAERVWGSAGGGEATLAGE